MRSAIIHHLHFQYNLSTSLRSPWPFFQEHSSLWREKEQCSRKSIFSTIDIFEWISSSLNGYKLHRLHQTLNTKIQSLWLKMYRLKIAPVHQGCHAFHTSPDSFCISTANSCLRGFSKFSCSTSTRVCSQCLHCWRRVCIFRSRGFPVTRRRKQWSASRAAAAAAILLYCCCCCCCCCCIWIIHICAGICNSGWLCHGIA